LGQLFRVGLGSRSHVRRLHQARGFLYLGFGPNVSEGWFRYALAGASGWPRVFFNDVADVEFESPAVAAFFRHAPKFQRADLGTLGGEPDGHALGAAPFAAAEDRVQGR